jgi:predicted nucleic acid-binding protein
VVDLIRGAKSCMTVPVFVDSNVLVYAVDSAEAERSLLAKTWLDELWRTGAGRLSPQVLNEVYSVLLRRGAALMEASTRRAYVRTYFAWLPVPSEVPLLERAWRIEERYGFAWWDALIIAAAQATGCRYLLTEDLQDGQELDGLLVVNPFLRAPAEVLRSAT